MDEGPGRARRLVAQTRQGRSAAPEDRRQGTQANSGNPDQALQEPAVAPGPDPCRGHLPGLHQYLRPVLRPAHQLPVAGQRGKLRHQHEPVAGRYRRSAAKRQRPGQDRAPGAGWPGGQDQAGGTGRQDHRRGPGQQGNGRRGRLAPGRSGQADPRPERLGGAPGDHPGQQRA
ncbi:hypothetical protein D3C72_1307850 [compost metagenome]